ncbi:phosphonate ABC transporter ATP-binding protein [Candidimonas nitroreducens]|uniref:Phosphonate ABC transporter ATP-binding protein n=1 Tax=Candidimonas nitroreducens TaxID=683354 RepID=A0A225LYM3_9BURK|nr:phosphonate ABC transporter ATP-binding protein [Candidimonas nitroreducens]OWT54218.1 phosphonate ABC transporter ATP-binding protein [Candidimonas nitroreducens]
MPITEASNGAAQHGGAALVLQKLTKEYTRSNPVLRGIDLSVAARGVTAVIGPSGTGKSTLIRCINRLVEPTSGRVLFHGEDITTLKGQALRRTRRRIGMIFQEYNLVERLSVMENVLSGRLGYVPVWRAWLRKFPREDVERAFGLIERVGLADHYSKRADALSGGQRQRVGIARALAQRPELLLADEPTSSLDPRTSVEIMELISELGAEMNLPVIVNIHNVELARRYAQRIIGMKDGAIVFDGKPGDLVESHLKFIYGGEDWL